MNAAAVVLGTATGAVLGWVCGRVPVWLGIRMAAAAGIGALVGTAAVVTVDLLAWSHAASGGLGAMSFGLSEVAFLLTPAVVLTAMTAPVVLRRLGWQAATLARYAPAVTGAAAALIASVWVARATVITGG